MSTQQEKQRYCMIASFLLAAVALWLVMHAGLLAALYAGLLVYALVHLIAPRLGSGLSGQRAKWVSVTALGSLIVITLAMGSWILISFFLSEAGSLPVLLKKMADLIEESRHQIPSWLAAYLPQSAEALQQRQTKT